MPSGVVIFLSSDFPYNDKSYGKIKGDDGEEYIFYSSDIMYIPESLATNKTRVDFQVHMKKDGRLAARNVQLNVIHVEEYISINPNLNSFCKRVSHILESVARNSILGECKNREISVNCSFGEIQGQNIFVSSGYVLNSERPGDFGHLVLQNIYAEYEDFWNNLSPGQRITFRGEVYSYPDGSGGNKYGIHKISDIRKIEV